MGQWDGGGVAYTCGELGGIGVVFHRVLHAVHDLDVFAHVIVQLCQIKATTTHTHCMMFTT